MNVYAREYNMLVDQFTPLVENFVKNHRGFVAGGAVTSIFSGMRINDFDVFFPSGKDLSLAMIAAGASEDAEKIIETDSALSVVDHGKRVQLIKVVCGTPQQVISGFDFTICQAAYYPQEGFIFGPEFLLHLAQRRLVFNTSSEYPLCSLYRLQKFIRRGFHFSGIEAIKLGLRIHALKIDNEEDLKKQLMGIDALFLKELTDSLAGNAEKKYDFHQFMAMLESWLDALAEGE